MLLAFQFFVNEEMNKFRALHMTCTFEKYQILNWEKCITLGFIIDYG